MSHREIYAMKRRPSPSGKRGDAKRNPRQVRRYMTEEEAPSLSEGRFDARRHLGFCAGIFLLECTFPESSAQETRGGAEAPPSTKRPAGTAPKTEAQPGIRRRPSEAGLFARAEQSDWDRGRAIRLARAVKRAGPCAPQARGPPSTVRKSILALKPTSKRPGRRRA